MSAIVIRPYQPEDFPRLCQIHDSARMMELESAGLTDAFLPLAVAAEREGLLDYTLHVATEDGLPVGFVAYSGDELAWLYVDPAHMRKGIGRRLVQHAIDGTQTRPLCIEVLSGNTAALTLYEAMGFRATQTLSGKMPGNEAFEVTVHCMELL